MKYLVCISISIAVGIIAITVAVGMLLSLLGWPEPILTSAVGVVAVLTTLSLEVGSVKKPKRPKLRPCPFCGGKGVLLSSYNRWPIEYFRVVCKQNGCGDTHDFYTDRQKAIDAWNRRDCYGTRDSTPD